MPRYYSLKYVSVFFFLTLGSFFWLLLWLPFIVSAQPPALSFHSFLDKISQRCLDGALCHWAFGPLNHQLLVHLIGREASCFTPPCPYSAKIHLNTPRSAVEQLSCALWKGKAKREKKNQRLCSSRCLVAWWY